MLQCTYLYCPVARVAYHDAFPSLPREKFEPQAAQPFHGSFWLQCLIVEAKQLYTETLLHTNIAPGDAFTPRRCYTQRLWHYTQTLLHTDAFTHRPFYTETLLHTEACTHRPFYTQIYWQRNTFTHTLLHTNIFTQRRCTHRPFEPCHGSVRLQCHIVEAKQLYTETLSRTKPAHRDAFTPKRFYTQTLLHDTQTLLHTDAFTHKYIYRETLLHTDAFTYKHLHTETCRHFFTFICKAKKLSNRWCFRVFWRVSEQKTP